MEFLMSTLIWALIIIGTIAGVLVLGIIFGAFRWVTVQEATAVAFKYLGRFVYCAMEFSGHHFEPDGSIALGTGPNGYGSCWCIWRWGGCVFYLRPFVKPANYNDYNDPDGFGQGVYVRLGDEASNPYTSTAETTEKTTGPEASSGSVALNVEFTSKMRVVNPYKFLFVAPRNVIKEAVEDRQAGVLRAWINSGDRKHAQAAKGNGAQLWAELDLLKLLPAFDEARNDWGLDVVPNSIVVKEVGFDPKYQAALESESQEKLLARAKAAQVGGPINLLMDQWIRSQADDRPDKSVDEARKAARADGSWERQSRLYKDLILANSGNLDVNRIEVGAPDGTTLQGDIGGGVAFAGALAALFGKGGGPGNRGRGGQPRGANPVPTDPADLEDWARRNDRGGGEGR